MNHATYFERLAYSVERIAHHAYYPGKEEAVEDCLEDIEELSLEGRITAGQRDLLREVLEGALLHAA